MDFFSNVFSHDEADEASFFFASGDWNSNVLPATNHYLITENATVSW